MYCLDERGIIEEPYQTPNDFAKKRGFIVKVLKLYKWKNVPVAKVLFYDCEKYASQILDEKTFPRVWGLSPLRIPHKVERIGAYPQVGRLLYIIDGTIGNGMSDDTLKVLGNHLLTLAISKQGWDI